MFGTGPGVLTEATVSSVRRSVVRETIPENKGGVGRLLRGLMSSQETSFKFAEGCVLTVVVIQASPFQRPSDPFDRTRHISCLSIR